VPNIIPVILCGGEGRRLRPLSTAEKPKPFHCFGRERSLFAEALLRCRAPFLDTRPIIVAARRHEALVRAELAAAARGATLVLEPCARNTCAAVIAGTLQALVRDGEALVLVVASDHVIAPVEAFQEAVQAAVSCAAGGHIVTFGVRPDHPSGEFGYVVPGEAIAGGTCHHVMQFREKPGHAEARALLARGALWNSGNFLAKAAVLAAAARMHAPENWQAVQQATAKGDRHDECLVLEPSAFSGARNTAVDVAVFEKAANVAVLPVSFHWRDVGTWAAVEAMAAAANP
jgi:mannose-1-phosphate guanylyltransferase/mannose-6-phosphate isomerase